MGTGRLMPHAHKPYVRRLNGRVMATCWCECDYVWIPTEWVGQRTASCRRPWCKAPEGLALYDLTER